MLFLVLIIVFKLAQWAILSRLERLAEKTTTDLDDVAVKVVREVRPPFYLYIVIYLSLQTLTLESWLDQTIDAVLIIAVVYQVVLAAQILINYLVEKRVKKGEGAKSMATLIRQISTLILWAIGLLLVLSNLGVDVSALIAGLGIGGIAIALALQNILSDLFSSFAIHFDKPFEVGDFVVLGEKSGTVEKIGIKTTRIRLLQGEELVVSNQELTSAQIRNFKQLQERRVVFTLGVTYETPNTKLKKIPGMVRKAVRSIKDTKIDRVHLKEFADSALVFEVVYYVKSSEYVEYMDVQHEINLLIKAAFEEAGIEFAFPTQTIHLQQ